MRVIRPFRLAAIDRIRADEAALHIHDCLRALLAERYEPSAGDELVVVARQETWTPAAWRTWHRVVWLWQCSVTGRDPLDTSPITPDELAILRLELI